MSTASNYIGTNYWLSNLLRKWVHIEMSTRLKNVQVNLKPFNFSQNDKSNSDPMKILLPHHIWHMN